MIQDEHGNGGEHTDSVKKAIVTGASRGIGRGIALCLAKDGYDVAVSYSTQERDAIELAKEIKEKYGRECHVFQASLQEPGAGVKLFGQAVEKLRRLDLLVNNAGVTRMESLLDLTEETLDYLLNLNFRNYLLMAREAARYMVKHGIRGGIINITSSRGERAYPSDLVYGGLKAGINRAIQSAALDVAPYGIRINNVAPGAIRIRSEEDIKKQGGEKNRFLDELGGRIPLGRVGLPEDVGNAVVFLASEKASYITGMTLRVDGGLILPGMPERTEPGGADRGWGYRKSVFDDSINDQKD
ncbi:MAG: SDR family oxidoreductase [Clostridiales bacterium]|jgi:NAD(P)-dependent dehydrogenase (short-subunit alcohol dehydrogenase family)|nr:SDR family oxidoreductase [Clostridiales bacterium]